MWAFVKVVQFVDDHQISLISMKDFRLSMATMTNNSFQLTKLSVSATNGFYNILFRIILAETFCYPMSTDC